MREFLKALEVRTRRPRVDQRRLADSEASSVLPLALARKELVDRSEGRVV